MWVHRFCGAVVKTDVQFDDSSAFYACGYTSFAELSLKETYNLTTAPHSTHVGYTSFAELSLKRDVQFDDSSAFYACGYTSFAELSLKETIKLKTAPALQRAVVHRVKICGSWAEKE
jgi:hypothetical protein